MLNILKKINFVVIGFVLTGVQMSFAQLNQPNDKFGIIPVVVPPSPEVGEMARIGQLGSELFTGASSTSIPLLELKAGGIKLPISLAYSNNGIKVNDIPTRVGLGWNLMAGGSVSRVIHDEPDDESEKLAPVDFNVHNQALLDYLYYATTYGYDTEQDIYSISAPGLSGKFFFDEQGVPRFVKHSNLRVQVDRADGISGFVITNGEGIKYYFGAEGEIEKTREIKLSGTEPKYKVQKTAWFLSKIMDPAGNYVQFNYSPIYFKTILGPSQNVTLKLITDVQDCAYCGANTPQVQYDRLDYDSYYLTGIQSSDNETVSFGYEARSDISGDNRLRTVTFSTVAEQVKKYRLNYQDEPTVGSVVNRKFLLTSVAQLSNGMATEQLPVCSMDYFGAGGLPDQMSLGQDFMGYFNGALNGNFFPKINGWQNYTMGYLGVNRDPNLASAQMGALKKITFATGGYDEYAYESHTVFRSEDQSQVVWQNADTGGPGSEQSDPNVYEFTITPVRDQQAPFTVSVAPNPGGPNEGDDNYWPPQNDNRLIAKMEVRQVSNNALKMSRNYFNYADIVYRLSLSANVSYKIRITAYGESNQASVYLKYDSTMTSVSTAANRTACGIRVASVKSFDPVTNHSNFKYYKYASVANPAKSSGQGNEGRVNVDGGMSSGWCAVGAPVYGDWYVECSTINVRSGALALPAAYSGSNIAYAYLTEADDPNFINGCTEHHFNTITDGSMFEVLNKIIPYMNHDHADLAGTEDTTTVYIKSQGTLKKTKKTVNNYGMSVDYDHAVTNYVARKRYAPTVQYTDVETLLGGYDLSRYLMTSSWITLNETVTDTYDLNGENPIRQTVSYTYANSQHLQPTRVSSNDSRGNVISAQLKYPVDFPSAVNTTLVDNNMITPVLEKKIFNGGSLIRTESTSYKDWFADGKVVSPELLSIGDGAALPETKLRYLAYNHKGFPLSLSAENGPLKGYIWGYNQKMPIMQIDKGSQAECYHENFEEFAGAATGSAHTGSGYYNGAYTVNWTRPNARNYRIGYFFFNGTAWKYKEEAYTADSFALSGGSGYDDIRIFPADAQVTTYTYRPLIGITSQTDAKGMTTYYEYDAFQRLKTVKDQNGNILKQTDYHYKN
nr:hypothetical protein [uncultured Pedobacter sp.]